MRLRDLVENPERWLDSHECSLEVGEALAARAANTEQLDALWSNPGPEAATAVMEDALKLAAANGTSILYWGVVSFSKGEKTHAR